MVKEVIDGLRNGELGADRALNMLTANDGNQKIEKKITPTDKRKYLKKLNKLTGLHTVKKILKEYLAYVQIQHERKNIGLKANNITMHMAFLGNPGTGKTTTARILGQCLLQMGLLNKGHLLETSRSELVGEYIGHTAQKTKKVMQKALGGVLFIDEAYSLSRGDERDFGQEAIDTMVKEMEDKREDIVIIFAGYPEEMKHFLKSNPGLASRIPIKINFPDYTIFELMSIASSILQDREYILTSEGKEKLRNVLKAHLNKGNSGNGRLVRNILENAFRAQAFRLSFSSNLSRKELLELQGCDFREEETPWPV